MSGIFRSYRRDDSAGWAGRLHDHLRREWGPDQVFMDIDAIAPGEDFRDAIARTIRACDVVLVVIGPDWVDSRDQAGKRRLDDERDIHRRARVRSGSSATSLAAGQSRSTPRSPRPGWRRRRRATAPFATTLARRRTRSSADPWRPPTRGPRHREHRYLPPHPQPPAPHPRARARQPHLRWPATAIRHRRQTLRHRRPDDSRPRPRIHRRVARLAMGIPASVAACSPRCAPAPTAPTNPKMRSSGSHLAEAIAAAVWPWHTWCPRPTRGGRRLA